MLDPTFASGSRSFNAGRMPVGNGLLMVLKGVMLPSSDVDHVGRADRLNRAVSIALNVSAEGRKSRTRRE